MEIHDACTPSYSKFFKNNKYDAIIGLSATIDKKTSYELDNNIFITKGEILNSIAPIIYKYSFDKAYKDSTTRKLNINIIFNKLDKIEKTIKSGSKTKTFYQTEFDAYSYWNKRLSKSYFITDPEKRELMFQINSKKRNDILYSLPSKIKEVKLLINHLDKKTILFGNDVKSLIEITSNTVSSYNSEKDNKKIRDNFEKGKIKVIASFKKLKQGANLTGLDNCIIMSYYSSNKDLVQRIGRLRDNGQIGNIFIFVTENTQEEIWFSKMFENFDNVKMNTYNGVQEYINKKNK